MEKHPQTDSHTHPQTASTQSDRFWFGWPMHCWCAPLTQTGFKAGRRRSSSSLCVSVAACLWVCLHFSSLLPHVRQLSIDWSKRNFLNARMTLSVRGSAAGERGSSETQFAFQFPRRSAGREQGGARKRKKCGKNEKLNIRPCCIISDLD